MSLLLDMFSFPFIVRAFVVGILVSLCAALLGVPLVLKRYSMIGDGLSHVSFGALSIAVACGWAPLPVSIPVVILAALGLLRLTERSRMGADAAIAVVSASSLAAGVIVTSLTTGMTTDVDSYMFGSILAMDRADVALSAGLSAAVLLLFVLFYHKLFAITFDESFSRATGVRVGLYNTFLSVLTALTIVLGMRMMGAMLITTLVIFPALTAMRLFKSFRGVVVCSGITAVVCFCVGLTVSYLLSTPVGATVVIADLAAFLICCVIGREYTDKTIAPSGKAGGGSALWSCHSPRRGRRSAAAAAAVVVVIAAAPAAAVAAQQEQDDDGDDDPPAARRTLIAHK